ncbi:hypothetical protein K3495_g6534 [Podosphaera aphanis]|nr:hypothetical protein K3495_g6534 [Podosphaera aphanis]
MAPNSIKSTPRKTPLKDCFEFNKKGKGKGFDVGNPGSCTREIVTA